MESYIIDSMSRWHYVPELSKGTNETQWSNQVYSSTQLPPARQQKYLNAIGWVYRHKPKGKNFRRAANYSMYGLGRNRKRYKRR